MCILHLARLHLDAKFALGIRDLYLELVKFTLENVDSYAKLVQTCVQVSLTTESGIHFQVKIPSLPEDCVSQCTRCCNKQALRFQWLHTTKVHFSLWT